MEQIFDWPPLVWVIRILLTLFLGAASLVMLVVFARFLDPRWIKEMWNADPPKWMR